MKKLNKKGFTLVELVVVIAIIGVLAAILVPSMMGYVKKTKLKTANANAKTTYNAVAEAVAECEVQGFSIDWRVPFGRRWNCDADLPAVSLNADGSNYRDVIIYEVTNTLKTNGIEAGEVAVNGENINGTWTFFAHWRKTPDDDIFGQYPQPLRSVDQCANSGFFGFFID